MSKRQMPITGFLAKYPRSSSSGSAVQQAVRIPEDARSSPDSVRADEDDVEKAESNTGTDDQPHVSELSTGEKGSIGVPGLSILKKDGPTQPKGPFPKRNGRAFVGTWYDKYPWIEYSGIALRGHLEDRSDPDDMSNNSGNFLSIMKLLASHSQTHREQFEGARNSRYLSPKVQNDLLALGAQWVRRKISQAVASCKFFALIGDESRDNSKTEQLCLTLRYLRPVDSTAPSKALEVVESILLTAPCEALTADYLTELIKDSLLENSINVSDCVSTSFDGAANFSGSKGGVQNLLRERYASRSIHVHCLAHKANLVLTAVCRDIPSIPLLFDTLQEVYVFVSSAAVHPQWMRIQRDVYPNEPPRELRALSETRWNARYESANIMWIRLEAIYDLLDHIIDNDVPDRRAKAEALSRRLDGPFVVGLSMMRWVLKMMSAFTIEMQKVDFNLSDAIARAVELDLVLQRPRADEPDEVWEDVIFGPAKDMCEELEIDFVPQRPVRRVRAEKGPRCRADYRAIFIKVCDALHLELQDRFLGEERQALYDGLDALNPAMEEKFLQAGPLIGMAQHFGIITKDSSAVSGLLAEVRTFRDTLARVDGKPGSLMTLLQFLNEREPIFHNIFQLARVCATIPVSSAQCERGFSGVRRIKNFMRSTMTHGRLSDLIVIHLNRQLASRINEEEVVDDYRDAAERRVDL
ncbi:hypothetical protein FOL46_001634 [Perkinsus olseni]|uniref:HAT C-terminal dimerisation domain-containing protein n=1 Tax=Perkinsus olseni TaxID=32597 RepID=A0A7J6KRC6_PEROL|nr:hypothetical protein FOL46_001634 [Perkinsus olseni]